MSEDNRNDNQQTMALLNKPVFNFLRYPTTYVTLLAFAAARPAVQQSLDRYLLPVELIAANPPQQN